ncbi:hypothetical protein QBC39DRAFT_373120 [Podospora conica]|nr:hypothetical protein QBC39DRAFT_373120 [Schizothecium conicum]
MCTASFHVFTCGCKIPIKDTLKECAPVMQRTQAPCPREKVKERRGASTQLRMPCWWHDIKCTSGLPGC